MLSRVSRQILKTVDGPLSRSIECINTTASNYRAIHTAPVQREHKSVDTVRPLTAVLFAPSTALHRRASSWLRSSRNQTATHITFQTRSYSSKKGGSGDMESQNSTSNPSNSAAARAPPQDLIIKIIAAMKEKQKKQKVKVAHSNNFDEEFQPGHSFYHLACGIALLMDPTSWQRNVANVIEEVDRAIEASMQNRGHFEFLQTHGMGLVKELLFSNGARKDNNSSVCHMLLQGLVLERVNPKLASKNYMSLRDLDVFVPETLYCTGLLLLRAQATANAYYDPNEAVDKFKSAIYLNKEFYQAWDALGVALSQHGTMLLNGGSDQSRLQQALHCFDQAIALNNRYAPAYANRGVAKMDTDPQGALEDLKKAIELDPNNAFAQQSLAMLYLQMPGMLNPKAAVEHLTKAIELQSANKMHYSMRALAYDMTGEQALAAKDWAIVDQFEKDPNFDPLSQKRRKHMSFSSPKSE